MYNTIYDIAINELTLSQGINKKLLNEHDAQFRNILYHNYCNTVSKKNLLIFCLAQQKI